ncbi:hypothetical protein Q604_UNBc4C00207G0001, partial [human gut metagenome]
DYKKVSLSTYLCKFHQIWYSWNDKLKVNIILYTKKEEPEGSQAFNYTH